MNRPNIADIKARYRITEAWLDFGLPGQPGKTCHSPFREDKTPSFSVFAEGSRFRDFAADEAGDVLDFIQRVKGCTAKEAIQFASERAGIVRAPALPSPLRETTDKAKRLPTLRKGTEIEISQLAERRSFSQDSLREAGRRGLLRFATLFSLAAWCVTDRRQTLAEFRRLDGTHWPAYGQLRERKAHCLGTGKNWPIGIEESADFPCIAFCEGAPDLLAALHFALAETQAEKVAPVAMLGAGAGRIAEGALPFFTGKHVRLFPHLDEAGQRVARTWAKQLADAGAARVDAFDFTGLVRADGRPGKDLADVACIAPDCFEANRKFSNLLP